MKIKPPLSKKLRRREGGTDTKYIAGRPSSAIRLMALFLNTNKKNFM